MCWALLKTKPDGTRESSPGVFLSTVWLQEISSRKQRKKQGAGAKQDPSTKPSGQDGVN